MIDARYANGMHYTCHEWHKIDFGAFVLDGLSSLRVDPFTWNEAAHGKPLQHCCRRGKKMSVASGQPNPNPEDPAQVVSCYILDCEKVKVFVFDSGGVAILTEYDPSSFWFSSPDWDGQAKIKEAQKKKKNGK
jgi:hypothetical protein